jgi:3-deoxy-7-phosphoheptulonate synthase
VKSLLTEPPLLAPPAPPSDHAPESDRAAQQPVWGDDAAVARARGRLRDQPPLVSPGSVRRLLQELELVAHGAVHVVQAGDCAEDPAESTAAHVARKSALLDVLAGRMKLNTGRPVIRVGRIAGQYGKPRSNDHETVGGVRLDVYRGHLVNGPEPLPAARRPDPERLVRGYHAAQATLAHLGWHGPTGQGIAGESWVWTSHEALLLDYEVPLVREDETGRLYLTSTHWPWIGERTRAIDAHHVALLSMVANPVGCKVGPRMTPQELVRLCERLDPERLPGRLTLIARLGAQRVGAQLPALVEAVRSAGHPVIWLVDPMHGNTTTTPGGLKTRLLSDMLAEVQAFPEAVRAAGGVPCGLHLETTPDDVTECAADAHALAAVGENYTSLCDPRLNPGQATELAAAWAG